METMSRASGAGAYSQTVGTGARSGLRSRSVNREVVQALIAAGLLLAELHEDVVEQRRRPESEEVRRQPIRPERLVDEDEALPGLFGGADAAGRLHPDHPTRLLVNVADRLEHHEGDRQRGGGLHLAGRRLDEVCTG